MFGGGSIQLARVFGIRIGVDASWFFVLFLIIWSLSGYYDDFALAVISALLFFLSILLHELGHAVVAMRNGIPIPGIDLWMFGGVAKMERDTDSPGVEFRVAVAGPLVTLAIVGRLPGRGHPGRRASTTSAHAEAASRTPPPTRSHGGARLPRLHQRGGARVQPDPRLPARRRAHRPGDRLVAHRRPQPRDPLRGPPGAGLRAFG